MTTDPQPPATRESVRGAIGDLVRIELGLEAELPADAELSEHLDSVQRLTLVVAIEDHFEICFEPADDELVHTLNQAVTVVMRQVEAGPADA